MANVQQIFELLERLESSDIAVNQFRCVRVRNRNATCHACADACTAHCISYADNALHIEVYNCIGCGTCCTACPTCALEARNPGDAQLLADAVRVLRATGDMVVFAVESLLNEASGRYDAAKVVSLANVGRIDESLLVELVRLGAQEIVVVLPRMPDAQGEKGLRMLYDVCESVRVVLEAWNVDARIRIADKLPASVKRTDESEFDESKRNFFSQTRKTAAFVGATAASYAVESAIGADRPDETPSVFEQMKVKEDGTLPHFLPDRRQRLLDSLAGIGMPDDVMVETRLWGHVVIDVDKCLGCRMCATFCPTGALSKFLDDDGATGIEHAPGDCVKCRCCQDVCAADAITISDAVFARDVLSGIVERHVMPPEEARRSNSHSIVTAARNIIGCDFIYER